MKKFLVAGVLALMTMFAVGTQTATAAPWRGAYRGHAAYGYGHGGYRTAERFHTAGRPGYGGYGGYGYGHNRGCW